MWQHAELRFTGDKTKSCACCRLVQDCPYPWDELQGDCGQMFNHTCDSWKDCEEGPHADR